VLGKVAAAKRYLDTIAPKDSYNQQATRQLADMAWNGVLANKGDDNFQRRWFNAYIGLASERPDLDRLASLLDGREKVEGLDINQDLRWAIVTRLNRFDYPGAGALLDAEQARDKSDSGQAAALAANVSRPDPGLKTEWLERIQDPEVAAKAKLPFSRLRTAMSSLYPAEQGLLAERSADQRLARLPALDKSAGPVYMRAYGPSLIPHGCTAEGVKRLQGAADDMRDLSAGTRRALLDALQESQRCVAIRQAMTVK
jgi:aminopeptidase N